MHTNRSDASGQLLSATLIFFFISQPRTKAAGQIHFSASDAPLCQHKPTTMMKVLMRIIESLTTTATQTTNHVTIIYTHASIIAPQLALIVQI